MAHWFAPNAELVAAFGFNALLGLSVWLVLASGRLMLGSTAFALIGAVATATTASHGWNLGVAAAAGVACAGAAGAIFGIVSARADSARFAVATLVLCGCASWAVTTLVPSAHLAPAASPTIILTALAIVALTSWFVAASRHGRAAACVAQDEQTAETLGIDAARVRVVAVIASALVAGLCGALMVLHRGYVKADDFSVVRSVLALAAVVVGGAGSAAGPLAGAALLGFAGTLPRLKPYAIVVDAAALFAFSIFLPGGLASIAARVVRQFSMGRSSR
jgi:ABC-type branched-subunit amino acid transport system permease subunit